MIGKKTFSRIILAGLLVLACVCMKPFDVKAASFSIDGDLKEWNSIPEKTAKDSKVDGFKIAKDENGNILFCAYGATQNTWDSAYQWMNLSVSGNGNANENRQFGGDWGWKQIAGTMVAMSNTSSDSNAGKYTIEMMIPASFFTTTDYSITFAGTTVYADEIPLISREESQLPPEQQPPVEEQNQPEQEPENGEAIYQGIVIDGSFSDWDGVTKTYDFNDNIMECAFIWDGDFTYIYLKENENMYEGNLHNATPYSNGNFCIETSTGYKSSLYILGPNAGKPSATLDGEPVEMCYFDHKYEVKVPVSKIRGYNSKITSLNFGTMGNANDVPSYIIYGASHWNPGAGESGSVDNPNEGEGGNLYDKTVYIKYDYDFSDWDNYPHDTIDYSTGGAHGADAEGALYSDGDYLYGHIMYYAAYYHDIFSFFELAVNGNHNSILQLSAKITDNNGKPIDNYKINEHEPGIYEFHVFGPETVDGGAWTTDYGLIYLEVDATGRVEAEFKLDQSRIAHFYKCEQTDLKLLEMRFIRIGDKWIGCAGTTTGPIVGITICLAVALGSPLYIRRRKYRSAIA